jgi:hypothetical protein
MQQVTKVLGSFNPLNYAKSEPPKRNLEYLKNLPVTQYIFEQAVLMGPKLQLDHADYESKKIQASVLIVTEGDMDAEELAKRFKIYVKSEDGLETEVDAFLLDQLEESNCNAWVFRFITDLGKNFSYLFDQQEYFVNASTDDQFNAGVFSCNGRQTVKEQNEYESKGGLPSAWKHVVESHNNQEHLNYLISLGDTIYADDFYENLPFFKRFKNLTMEQKYQEPFTPLMRSELQEYFFRKYCHIFSLPELKTLLALLLCIFTWDDHDIQDGAGSYDPKLEQCPVFRGIFEVAFRAFLVFQQHTNPELKCNEGYIGNGCNKLFHLGPVSILNLDGRSERTSTQVFSKQTLGDVKESLLKPFPKQCKHLLVMLGSPIAYPSFKGVEKALDMENDFQPELMDKIRKHPPEALDDLRDEWRSVKHIEERIEIIQMLQDVVQEKIAEGQDIRVTIIAGDVHITVVTKFFDPNVENRQNDPKTIYNWTTSPIGNESPAAMKIILKIAAILDFGLKGEGEVVMEGTNSNMDFFTKMGTEKKKDVIAQQNWLRIKFHPHNEGLEGVIQSIIYPKKPFYHKTYDYFIYKGSHLINWCSSLLTDTKPIRIEPKANTITKLYNHFVPPLTTQIALSENIIKKTTVHLT